MDSIKENPIVLYVEDNDDNRLLIRRILEAEDFTVIEAANAKLAEQQIMETQPDLILMDINMPDMDGYTLTNKIKSNPRFSKIPVIAITANVMRGDRERTLEAGCDGYIQKPIDVDTLPEQIRRYLKR